MGGWVWGPRGGRSTIARIHPSRLVPHIVSCCPSPGADREKTKEGDPQVSASLVKSEGRSTHGYGNAISSISSQKSSTLCQQKPLQAHPRSAGAQGRVYLLPPWPHALHAIPAWTIPTKCPHFLVLLASIDVECLLAMWCVTLNSSRQPSSGRGRPERYASRHSRR